VGTQRTRTPPPAEAPQAVANLLYQLLETEMGGVQVYRTALQCAVHPELVKEWSKYLAETEHHVVVARRLLADCGLDPDAQVTARLPVRHSAEGLVKVMLEALAIGTPTEAQLTAVECVVNAETKDHQNWSLIGRVAKQSASAMASAMKAAYDEVEADEDHHLYHSQGWARELWVEALGLPAVLPPPEEEQNVDTAIDAARARDGGRPKRPQPEG
jgi:hypothetical protein